MERDNTDALLAWMLAGVAIAILATALIAWRLNRPLAGLAKAAEELGKGGDPPPIPETGPSEIRAVAHAFNQMKESFKKEERERATFLAGVWFAARRRPFRKYHVFSRVWRIDWPLMGKLVAVGAPISIAFLLEYGLFGAAGLLMGLISTTALAAHQIALQIAAILFMVPFGVSMAATVRVGQAVGRRDTEGGAARRLVLQTD